MVEAVALYNFERSSEDELSFRKGQKLVIFRKAEENWFSAAVYDGEKSGLIPMNYVKVKPCSFLQQVTRSGAESLLDKQKDGAFVIRRSESDPSNEKNFSLSVKYGESIQHFKILTDLSNKFFLWVVKFNTLNELVDYYKAASVSRTQQIFLKEMNPPGANGEFGSDTTEYAKAKFDFNGEEEGEITFHMGDEIEILKKLDENWWEGRLRPKAGQRMGMKGLFPASYVQLIK
ncbi:growth factor receptor-bound protein 2-like isoform X2 [Acanthaster planci]|uniref:Growth factor receptor-bound protein 2-like isoform X2 n=1 Tax=Acanthaster planci TaxID=133434 RepID=A0A8B7XK69_ACAPL|nr:growth factor receptor-bound protein 2-like isoform X2 [Acanthaster planci]